LANAHRAAAVRASNAVCVRLEESPQLCAAVLGMAMVVSGALCMWWTRGTVFFSDEFTYFVASRGFDPSALLRPHNGHLIFAPRLIYATVFALFGPDYVVFRLLEVLGIALVSGLFFVYTRRRVGAAVALPPSVLLLFLGSSPDVTLSPLGITHVYSVAAGVGALLALDRGDRRGDLACCALLAISVATFSIGLAFVAGVAISVLLRGDRVRRSWIVLVPIVLYGAWSLAPKLGGPLSGSNTAVRLWNIALIPNFAANAAGAVVAALAGLSHDFTNPGGDAIGNPGAAPDITSSTWGFVIVGLAVAALVARYKRLGVPAKLWTSLGVVLAFWASTALVEGPNRYPYSQRYVYAGAVGVLLAASDGLGGVRLPRRALPFLFAATFLALGANITQFRAASGVLRADSTANRTVLAAVQLAGQRAAPTFLPPGPVRVTFAYLVVGGARPTLEAVRRNGSYAFTLPELRAQAEGWRELADKTLAGALRLRLTPAPMPPAGRGCLQAGTSATPRDLALHAPGIELRSPVPATVRVRRFAASFSSPIGRLSPRSFAVLRIPPDSAPDPWHITLSTGAPITVCALPG
jgi:hypothetical protein